VESQFVDLVVAALAINMIIPIRCFTCGKVVGNKWERYLQLLQNDYSEAYVASRVVVAISIAFAYYFRLFRGLFT
jgi:hypothetical protein